MPDYCILCGQSKAENKNIRVYRVPKISTLYSVQADQKLFQKFKSYVYQITQMKKELLYHQRIQEDLDQRKTWMEAVGKYLPDGSVICSQHFPRGSIGRKKLLKGSIPLRHILPVRGTSTGNSTLEDHDRIVNFSIEPPRTSRDVADIETIRKNRKIIRICFVKAANELEGHLKKVPLDIRDIEIYWECLKPKWDNLSVCDDQLYNLMLKGGAGDDQLVEEMEQRENYLRRFTSLRLHIEKLLKHEEELSVHDGEDLSSCKRKSKLLEIKFKQYDGSVKDWLSFWSQFEKIHLDEKIENCDKINYLLQATVPGSCARQIVESFSCNDENYDKILECMRLRFGSDDIQIGFYVRELLKLVLRAQTSNNQQFEITKLYDQIETQLTSLNTLGITLDKYAPLIFPLIESCLPHDLLKIWLSSPYNSNHIIKKENMDYSEISEPDNSIENKLQNLLLFLCSQVENEQ